MIIRESKESPHPNTVNIGNQIFLLILAIPIKRERILHAKATRIYNKTRIPTITPKLKTKGIPVSWTKKEKTPIRPLITNTHHKTRKILVIIGLILEIISTTKEEANILLTSENDKNHSK